jgi:hypothetical protein
MRNIQLTRNSAGGSTCWPDRYLFVTDSPDNEEGDFPVPEGICDRDHAMPLN